MGKVIVEIIEQEDRESFKESIAFYYNKFEIIDCKFQRNLFYALDDGKGSSPQRELKQEYVAFIVFKEKE